MTNRNIENERIAAEILNSPLFKEYQEDYANNDNGNAFDEFMNNINEKMLKSFPLLSARIIEDVNNEIEACKMFRIGDVYDNLNRYGKVTVDVDLTTIEENVRIELKELIV